MAGYGRKKYFGQFKQDTGHGANILDTGCGFGAGLRWRTCCLRPQSPYPGEVRAVQYRGDVCPLFLGWEKSYVIALLKGGFAFITRGAVAGALSLAGGMLSVTVMLCSWCCCEKISYLSISIFGAGVT